MRISKAKWVRFSLILFVSALFFPLASARGSIAQMASPIAVESSSAQSNFPDDITFELTANVEADVAQVDLVYQQSRVETLELLPGEFQQSGDELSATAKADFATYFVPAGIDLTYHWVITFRDETVAETPNAVVTWLDDRFDWDRVDGKGVEIYSYDRSDDFVEFVVDTANTAVESLTSLYDPPSVLPIRIWLYASGEDFAGTQAANSQEWAAGAAYPGLQVILAVIPRNSKSEVERIIPHEISHQILAQATLNPYNAPATWIDEGLAVVAQIGGKGQYQRLVQRAYDDDDLLSLRGLISSFPYNPTEATLAYGESYLVMKFILDSYGGDAIQAIIGAYRQGTSHDDVLEQALGMSVEELEQAWLGQLGATHVDGLAA